MSAAASKLETSSGRLASRPASARPTSAAVVRSRGRSASSSDDLTSTSTPSAGGRPSSRSANRSSPSASVSAAVIVDHEAPVLDDRVVAADEHVVGRHAHVDLDPGQARARPRRGTRRACSRRARAPSRRPCRGGRRAPAARRRGAPCARYSHSAWPRNPRSAGGCRASAFVATGDGRLDAPEAGDARRGRRLARRRPRHLRLGHGARRPAGPRRARARARAARGDATRTCCSSATTRRRPRSCSSASPPSPARSRRTRASPTPRAARGDNVVRRGAARPGRGRRAWSRPGARCSPRSGSTRCPRPRTLREAQGDGIAAADVVAAHEAVLADPGRAARAPEADRARGRPPPAHAARAGAAPPERDALFHRISAFVNAARQRRRARPRGEGAREPARPRPPARLPRRRPRRPDPARRPPPRAPAAHASPRSACAPSAAAAPTARRSSARWTSTSPSTPRTGTPPTPATRARSTRRRASSRRRSAASGSSSPSTPRTCPAGVEVVAPGTPEYLDVMARAKYFVNNVNFPNEYVKRPGSVHVMTHHGTPLKYMGMDLRSNPVTAAKMDFDALLRRCERWDFSVSSNPLSSEVWAKVYPVGYENLEVGYPRNDVLATRDRGGRRGRPRVARPRARAARRALRADAPRLGDGPRAGARPGRGRGGAGPGRCPARPRALLLRCGPGRPRRSTARGGCSTSPRIPPSRPCAWRRTSW